MIKKSFLLVGLVALTSSLVTNSEAIADIISDVQLNHGTETIDRLVSLDSVQLPIASDSGGKKLQAGHEVKNLVSLGRSYRLAHQYRISIKYYKQALSLNRRNNSLTEVDVASVYNELAESYIGLGSLSQAQKTLKEAVGLLNNRSSRDCTITAEIGNLATFYERTGQYTASEPIYRRWLMNEEKKYGPNHRYLLFPLEHLASNLARQGRFKEAEKLCSRAVDLCSTSTFTDTLLDVDVLDTCANVYTDSGSYDIAERMYKNAISIIEKRGEALGISELIANYSNATGESDCRIRNKENYSHNFDRNTELSFHPEMRVLNDLAILYQKKGQYKQAQLIYELALKCAKERDQSQIETRERETAKIMNNLASVLADQRDFLNAEKLYCTSLALKEKFWDTYSPYVLSTQINYMTLLVDTDRFAEATRLRAQARRNDTYKCLTKNI